MELNRIGVWLGPLSLRSAAETRELAPELEELGFGAIWFGEGVGTKAYFTPPEHTAMAREVMGAGPLLAPEQAFVLDTDPSSARAKAREHMTYYLALDNYRRNVHRLGFADDELDGGGSDRLVDAIVAWGDVDAVRDRVKAHLDAGADHVCVQAVGDDPLDELRRVAPALRDL